MRELASAFLKMAQPQSNLDDSIERLSRVDRWNVRNDFEKLLTILLLMREALPWCSLGLVGRRGPRHAAPALPGSLLSRLLLRQAWPYGQQDALELLLRQLRFKVFWRIAPALSTRLR
jgi:hypothetical protein